MFNLNNYNQEVSFNKILEKVNEYDLWRYYCRNFKNLNESFLSELYNDRNPSCRIYVNNNNRLTYKDFGDEGKTYDILSYIQEKYKCTFLEALRIIYNDFKLNDFKHVLPKSDINVPLEEKMLLKPKIKAKIDILSQTFNIIDYNYWNQYHIPLSLLEEYNVYSCKEVFLYKNDKIISFKYTKDNPIYAYKFINNGNISYKIYFPLRPDKKRKWLFSGGSQDDIEGYDQLNHFSDILILTKSLKDVMVYRLLGYNAISLQGEANKLSSELVNKLYKRFDNIIVNYDNDNEGIKGSVRLNKQYSFKYFFIDEEKDISDYCKKYGLEKTKEMIKNKLNDDEFGYRPLTKEEFIELINSRNQGFY